MTEQREDPEKILGRIQAAQQRSGKGKLKIYLGAAPGVGKTYTMLQDALEQRAQGSDVIVGVVETHGRYEIGKLLEGLEILPKQSVNYREKKLLDFDLDAALQRAPSLILIDEMAHTNVPGLRHQKRWQDIKELLDRGIDVYTTLNVQHVESLNDKVSQLIHAPIKETVPDSMLELADTIEMVDLSPDDLLKRLEAGKVYFHQNVQEAKNHFFRKINLIALRELALRVAAEHVAAEVILYRKNEGIKELWSAKEKILVCVGGSSKSNKLIRIARQLATHFQTQWMAVYVASPDNELFEKQRGAAVQNLRFAESLGAKTHIVRGFNIAQEIIEVARQNNITLIVVQKNMQKRWKDWFFSRLADQLIRYSGTINVYVVTDIMTLPDALQTQLLFAFFKNISLRKWTNWKWYGIALGMVLATSAIGMSVYALGILNRSNILILYLVSIIGLAVWGAMGPAILAALLSVMAYVLLFVQPVFDIQYYGEYLFTLIIFLMVAQIMSHLALAVQQQREATHFSEHQRIAVYELNQQLANLISRDKILEKSASYLENIFESQILFLVYEQNRLVIRPHREASVVLTDKEIGIAQWVYNLGQMAGLGTNTLPFSDALYIPLLGSKGSLGVLRVHPLKSGLLIPEQIELLQACSKQIALTLEADEIYEQKRQMELEAEIDHIRSALLQYVSQDLRGPLASILAVSETINTSSNNLNAKQLKTLGDTLEEQAQELDRLIKNLFQITYLETGSLALQKTKCSINVLLNTVIKMGEYKWKNQEIVLNIPIDLPLIDLDEFLMQEVFINIIDNAIQCSPPDKPIKVEAIIQENNIMVSVRDYGLGILPQEAQKIFEKFYRGTMVRPQKGLGLGLSICRKIIDAHGGSIWIDNIASGGAIVRFILPL